MRAYWETDASMSKILTVDDDRHILTSLSVILQAEGFEVKAFSDGASALDAFSRLKPDLAVIDIKMPRMDGLELLQKLRQKSWIPKGYPVKSSTCGPSGRWTMKPSWNRSKKQTAW